MTQGDTDRESILRAINVGEKGRLTAPPNPWVGCLIVNKGQIVGEGFHRAPGESHAEIVALQQAKGKVEGATIYLTLEPCSHYGRTPPCVEAIVKAKPKRVVIGIMDPDEKVSGRGIARLQEANIEVEVKIAEEEVRKSLEIYLHHRRLKVPFCLAKIATTIDGRIAARDGSSQWISSPEARADAHNLRAESQAIMIGVGTAIKDKPRLTVRDSHYENPRQPLRVILDSKGSLSQPSPLLEVSDAPTLVVTSEICPEDKKKQWRNLGVDVIVAPRCKKNGVLELPYIMKELAKRGVLQVMVEGGSQLQTHLMRERLLDKLITYVGPKIVGGEGVPFIQQLDINTMQEAIKFNLCGVKHLGNTIRLDYTLVNEE